MRYLPTTKKYATMQAKGIRISPLRHAYEPMRCVFYSFLLKKELPAEKVCDDMR